MLPLSCWKLLPAEMPADGPRTRKGIPLIPALCVQKPVHVEAFAASTFPVTVGEYRSFALDQRGYDRPELWQPQDFKHFKQAGQRHPATWTVKVGACGTLCV